jgi:hypothetical protein
MAGEGRRNKKMLEQTYFLVDPPANFFAADLRSPPAIGQTRYIFAPTNLLRRSPEKNG